MISPKACAATDTILWHWQRLRQPFQGSLGRMQRRLSPVGSAQGGVVKKARSRISINLVKPCNSAP